MRARDRRLLLCGAVLVVFLVPLAGAADEPGITVLGTGELMAKPDLLEIQVRAAAEAELTGDAVVKYDDTLRRIRGAFAKLQMNDLAIYGLETAGNDDARLSSDKLIDLPVRVTLRVRFAIEDASPEKGAAERAH